MVSTLGGYMRRRDFIALVCGAAVAQIAARAQRTILRVGLVSIGADSLNPVNFLPFWSTRLCRETKRNLGETLRSRLA